MESRTRLIKEGNLVKAILILAVPVMINNFILSIYNMADAFWLARFGIPEVAAISYVWPINHIFLSVGIGIAIAATSLISREIGKNNLDRATNYSLHLLVFGIIISFLLALIGFFSTPIILKLLNARVQIRHLSKIYLQITFIGLPFIVCFNCINAILSAQGDTVHGTLSIFISSITNIILDPIFIFDKIPGTKISGLNMGLKGAAVATVISQIVLLILGVLFLKRHSSLNKLEFFNYNFNYIKDTIKISVPAIIGHAGSTFGFIILNYFVESYGTDTIAAFGIINKFTSMIMEPSMGIGIALITIIGQNIGAKNYKRTEKAFYTATMICLCITIFFGTILYILRYEIVKFLLAIDYSHPIFKVASICLFFNIVTIPLMGMFSIYLGVFQGSGYTKYVMLMEILRLLIIRIPLIMFLQKYTDLGSTSIWLSVGISNTLIVITGHLLYIKRKWLYN